ncbi:TELO2-interacting protein 1-like protein [Schistosoma japonicum]|nr:TELO2-interacting protein 1-like protein [Schistosoma japonicum]
MNLASCRVNKSGAQQGLRDPSVKTESRRNRLLDDRSAVLYMLCTENPECILWSVFYEEYCLAIALPLNAWFSSWSYRQVEEVCVYSTERLPTISHICSFLLDLIEHSKNRDICYKSLNLLSRIAYPSSAFTNAGNEDLLRDLLVDSLKRFLPGFSQTFFRVITGDDKIGSNVKMVYAILTVNELV